MADRKLVVQIIGDDKSLQQALTRSTAATAKFGDQVNKNLRRGVSTADSFAPLLKRNREMQAETDALSTRLNNLDASLAGAGAGARGMTAGLGPLVARAGLAGFALSAAYTASQRLQENLKTTGQEAFTTTGKIRNFSAALINADIIGGINALTAVPKTLEEAGISAAFAEQHYEAFARVAKGVGDVNAAGAKSLQDFDDAAQEAGTSSGKLAEQALALANATRIATATQDALNFALRTTNTLASGAQVALATRREDLGGPLGPGGVAAEQAQKALFGDTSSGRLARPLGPTAKNLAAQTIAQAQGELDELLRLQIVERDRLTKALAASTGNVQQREALNQQLAAAGAAVIGTRNQISANARAAAAAAEAAREAAAREAEAERKEAARRARERRERAAALRQARQFRALGLSPEGGVLTPTVANLRKQLAQLTDRLVDEGEMTPKIQAQLNRISKVLRRSAGKVTEDSREAIRDMFRDIRGAFKDEDLGPDIRAVNLTDKILGALGFGKDLDVAGRLGRDRRRGGAGSTSVSAPPPQVFTGPITVVADDPDAFLRQMQKKANRTTATSRGRFPGKSMGLA